MTEQDDLAAIRAALGRIEFGMMEVRAAVLVNGGRLAELDVAVERQRRMLAEHGEMLAEILQRLPPEAP